MVGLAPVALGTERVLVVELGLRVVSERSPMIDLDGDGAVAGTIGTSKAECFHRGALVGVQPTPEVGDGHDVAALGDHGGKERIQEYSPYDSQHWGEGLGREYAGFLAETLKPHIDKNFRTLTDRAHTGIGGSSMGGLISIYAGLMFPQVYSKFMIFSPSLWASPKIYAEPMQFATFDSPTKIYLYGGSREGSNMVPNLKRFKDSVEKSSHGRAHIRMEIDPHGRHNEDRWGAEFPKAAEWLFH